ncbi:MAG: RdgB/HAM1 family non-canonical purine NTP pyrophosphatase [Sumerlaeia bacterium]
MPTLLIATGNAHKVDEIQTILHGLTVDWKTTRDVSGLDEEPEESAPDFAGNALIKARAWANATGLWTIADDSGIVVDALDGRPGVKSARYAPTTEERNAKLLKELDGVPMERRTARFLCVAALVGPDGQEETAEGLCEGRIAFHPAGEGGFGYDPLFLPDGTIDKHLAELTAEEKHAISHRGRAFRALRPKIEMRLGI